MKLLKFTCLLFLYLHCSNVEKKIPTQKNISCSPISSTKEPVLFVPGFKGSELYRAGEKVWLTESQGLGFSSPDLSLKDGEVLEPAYPVTELQLFFGLVKFKIYSDWLSFLDSQDNWEKYTFTYDWRIDNNIHSAELLKYISCISTRHNGKKVHVVGHSNGGNLSLSVMNKKPDLFASATLVGAPIRGGIGFMEDLIPGFSTGLNSKITGPCVVGTFDLPYTFFPRSYAHDTKELLRDGNGKSLEANFFQAEDWEKYNLGFFHKDSKCKNLLSKEQFQSKLNKAKAFKDSFDFVKTNKYPPILVVYTEDLPTLGYLKGAQTQNDWAWDFQNKNFVPGDGRVTAANAQPDPKFTYQKFISKSEHSAILNEKAVQEAIARFISGQR